MKHRINSKRLVALIAALSLSSALSANPNESADGFSPKQKEVVVKAFEILSTQMWDQVTDENLVTLSQAAAIAMDAKNPHYNPKAAYTFMTRILEIQYDYKPLSELTQKVFKSAVLSLMRGDYRFLSESDRVLRNKHEFFSDLRQMREMLKRAKLVEQRKANECTFVLTLNPVIKSIKAEIVAKLAAGDSCSNLPEDTNRWCDNAYHSRGFCAGALPQLVAENECSRAAKEILKTLLIPAACANPIEIAAKLIADAPYITVEQIEKTLQNEDTELAFNMGLAVTDPATQRTYHLVRDRFSSGMNNQGQEKIVEDEEFDLDKPSHQATKHAPLAIEAPKTKEEELADFINTMDGPRFKSVSDARDGKAIPAIGPGTSTQTPNSETPPEPKAATPQKTGFWNRVMGMFGY